MAHLRKVALLVVLSIGMLACSLIAGPASPTASVPASPITGPSDTPASTSTVQVSNTHAPSGAPTGAASPSETPNPDLQSVPIPFANLMGIRQYFNPVGIPVQTWNGIPIMPQATTGQEFKPGAVYSFKAAAAIAQGVSFYKGKISALGYSLNGEPATGSAGTGSNALHNSVIYCYKGSQILLIYIAAFDNDTGHIIVVISTQ
jgi:hypothetical protein